MSSDFSDKIHCLPKQRGFKMAFLNIVSLPKRFDEINFTMSNKLLDINIMSFGETRLNSTIPDSMIRIDGYDIIRKDRSRSGGGVCIYIRNTINYQIRTAPVLEVICIKISKPHSRPAFIVVVVYRPSDASPDFFIHLENLLKKIDNENQGIYILGDLNCDFSKPNPKNFSPYSKFINYPN